MLRSIFKARILLGALVVGALLVGTLLFFDRLPQKVDETQAQFVADSIRRSAVQCYAIEGQFPETFQGVAYLEENYGLVIDHKRFVVYYESMGGNLIPQINVYIIPQSDVIDQISQVLGFGNGG